MTSYNLQIEVIDTMEPGIFLKLTGELDQLSVRDLKEKLVELSAEKTPQLVFDLEGIEFMASAGLSVFAFYQEIFQKNGIGQQMKLINCSESVLRVFKITRMDEVISIR